MSSSCFSSKLRVDIRKRVSSSTSHPSSTMGNGNSSSATSGAAAVSVPVGQSWNLYENEGASEAVNIVEADISYPEWEQQLLPPALRSKNGGVQDSYPGILNNNDCIKIPALLPVDYCVTPQTCTLYLRAPEVRNTAATGAASLELKLNERIRFDKLESELLNYFNGLFSLGYKQLEFKVIRPFAEISYVSPGAATGGFEDILPKGNLGESQSAIQNSAFYHFPKQKDCVKVLYWAMAIEGEVSEVVDELSAFKKQIQEGKQTPDAIYRQMKRKKWPQYKIQSLIDFVAEWEANKAKRGRRALQALDLNWTYGHLHERIRAKQGGSGAHSSSDTSKIKYIRRNQPGLSGVFAIREMYYHLLKDHELQKYRENEDLQVLHAGKKGQTSTAYIDNAEKPPDIPHVGVQNDQLLPFITVEKAENENVKDFLRSANISLLRDRPGRMVRCLKIASDLLSRSIRLDDTMTQKIFFSLETDLRELFVIGAKQRLRDLYLLYDKGHLDRTEFGHKVEQMSLQISDFIDSVVLPCLSYRDCTIEIQTREDLALLTKHLDSRCFVTENFNMRVHDFLYS